MADVEPVEPPEPILGNPYDAQTAVDGDHALRSVIALHPDLIILDVHG
jgi:chemotaxis response regulator CheB